MKMRLNAIKLTLVFVLSLWAATYVYGQLSKVHYISPLPYGGYGDISDYFNSVHLYVSTPEDQATFTIRPLGSPISDWSPPVVVTKNTSYKVKLENNIIGAIPQDFPAKNVFSNKGYEIVSDKEIYVSVRAKHDYHAGAIVSKGLDGLGKRFRVAGMERTTSNDMSFFSIASTKNNTIIDFTSDPSLRTSQGIPLPPNVTLDKHEVFIALFYGENVVRNIGTLIESNKDIVVTTGTMYGSFSNEIIDSPRLTSYDRTDYFTGGDMGIDQLVSITSTIDAKEYILVKGDSFNSIENALIIADENGTTIEINGAPYSDPETGKISLAAGEHFFVEGTSYSTGGALQFMHIKSNKNIYVFQGTGDKYLTPNDVYDNAGVKIGERHNYSANQGMFFVPPLNCASTGDVESIAKIDEVDASTPFNGSAFVLSKTGSTVTVNGTDINSVATSSVDVPTGGSTYTIHRINNLTGDVAIKGSDELYVSYFNVNLAATSGAFYSGFTLEPRITPELNISSLGSCVFEDFSPNVSFFISSTAYDSFDGLKWQKKNETTGAWGDIFSTGIKDAENYQPLSTGQYRAKAEISCLTNPILYSEPLVVGYCPPDSDADGVIDNLDLDKDNDGIYNFHESYGSFDLDFSDLNNPKVIANSSFPVVNITPNYVENGAVFIGTSTSEFTTSFTAPSTAVAEAKFIFDKEITLELSYKNNTQHIISDKESFILASVNDKAPVSLLNPANELLIDTNLDGVFEADVTSYTSSSIHFKFNPNVPFSGDYTFTFVKATNNISDGIRFSHQVDGSLNTSTFIAKMRLVNLGEDSNMDGAYDELSLDSDADGCPDYVEAGFTNEDNPLRFGDNSLTVDSGEINADGTVAAHDYNTPINAASGGKYYFQLDSFADAAVLSQQPINTSVTEGEAAVFTVSSSNAYSYQWLMDNVTITDNSVFKGTNTNTLTITGADTSLNGKNFSVSVNSKAYLCQTLSSAASLTVLSVPNAPVLNRLYSFCSYGTVADLKSEIKKTNPGTNLNVYTNETGGTPLSNSTTLISEEDYFVATYNAVGTESVIRSMTIVVVPNPTINTTSTAICKGETVTLTVIGVPKTVLEYESSLDSSYEKFLSYGGSHYFLKKEPMTWTAARNLIKSQGAGASMYVINDKSEENAVYNELLAKGYAGTPNTHFWLGLRQMDALKNGKVDEGWVWLDGRPLDPASANWRTSEPNDWGSTVNVEDGQEDYGQFDYEPSGITWNDMADNGGGGNSWPVFEFTGTTSVKWYKQEGSGPKTLIPGTSNSITVSPSVTTSYFYEVEANGLPCDKSITITLNTPPAMLPAANIEACDNNLDGDSTDMNEAEFDLDAQRKKIIFNSSAVNRDVFFYESNTKALSVSDSIPSTTPFKNTVNPQTLHYRIKNKLTGCFSDTVGTFDLIVNDLPPELIIPDLHECDDSITGNDKDGEHLFDLTNNTSVIEGLLGNSTIFDISYHATPSDAESGSLPITTYTTLAADNSEKEIFVRLKNKTTGCVRYDNSFKVVVDKLPELKTTSITLEQCESDGAFKYNLNNVAPHFSSNHANESFEFYKDTALTDLILDTKSFTVSSTTDVYLKVINNKTGCERYDDMADSATNIVLTLKIGTNIVPSSFSGLSFTSCFDSKTSTTLGYGSFDSSIFQDMADALILARSSYNSPTVEIRFYENELDAIYQQEEIAIFNNGTLTMPMPYTNSDAFRQEIWAGIEDIGVTTIKCLGRFKVADFIIGPNPVFDLPEDLVFCQNLGFDTIYVTNPSATYTYAWARNGVPLTQTTQNYIMTDGGTYSVTATNPVTGCSTTKAVVVYKSEIASFEPEDITVYDLTGDGSNRIVINNSTSALGIGDYEFALNENPYQDSPIFENVPPGIHTLSVKDKNGCGIVRHEVSVIGYPFYFTPNGDGKNDTWQILGANATFQPSSIVYIFDRHGRLMAKISADGNSWDGSYNGTPMPADDYWFRAKLEDGRSFTGHFSLIR